jgi:ferric-dicitrate binding protein FerR (iron transport regulator)
LLRQPRPAAVDAERAARVRRAVHAAWRDNADRSRIWKRGVVFAAVAAVLVFSLTLTLVNWLRDRSTPQATYPIASTLFATSEVVFQHNWPAGATQVGSLLMPGTGISTNGGRGAIALANGVELRLDSNTAITVDAARRVSLTRGAVYLDSSNRKGPPQPIEIVARGSVIRDIGTRYEVRLSDQELRVRVRDGAVQLERDGHVDRAPKGTELLARADGSVSTTSVDPFAADWAWTTAAAPPFVVANATLEAFLQWAAREGGWTIEWSTELRERARTTILHGAIDGMTPAEALDVVLPTCGLSPELINGRLRLRPMR